MAGSDLYTGTLDVLILKALSWGPMHGYGVGKWIRDTTREALQVQEGALYPALHRLERKGMLEDEWGVSETGREAKYYTPHEPGAHAPAGRSAPLDAVYARGVGGAQRGACLTVARTTP